MDIHRFDSEEKALDAASSAFEELLRKSQRLFERKSLETLVFLSGGSSLKILERISDTYLGDHLTVCVLDERFSSDDSVNNFAQIMKTKFYEDARDAGSKFIDSRVMTGDSIDDLAERIERKVRRWKDKNPNGKIVATIGVGQNSHVAGIMPYPESEKTFNQLFNDKKKWVVGYDSKDKDEYPKRITSTLFLIRMIEHAITFVVGEAKIQSLNKIQKENGSLHIAPIRILRTLDDVQVFTDISS